MADYMKIPEVAQLLGLSEKTVRRRVKAGEIPSVLIGGVYRISRAGLDEYLQLARVRRGKAIAPTSSQPPLNGFEEQRRYSETVRAAESWPYHALDSWVRTIQDLIADYEPIIGGLPERPSGEEYRQLRMLLVPFLKRTGSINKALYESGMGAASNYLWEAVRAGEPVPQDLEQKLREFHEVVERLDAEFRLPAREWLQRLPENAELHSGLDETVERWRQELPAVERQAVRVRKNAPQVRDQEEAG